MALGEKLVLHRPLHPLLLAVGLRVVGRRVAAGEAVGSKKLTVFLADEGLAVVADDAPPGFRKLFHGPLEDKLNVQRRAVLAELMGDDIAALAIEDGAEIRGNTVDLHMGDVRMPVLVGAVWGAETCPLASTPGPFVRSAPALFRTP